jgi:hypothetical protein
MRCERVIGFSSVVGLCVLLLTQACGGSDSSPAPTPTPPVVTLTSVTISGISDTASVGQQVALKATANRSDGTTVDVTAQATWASSNRVVADVSTTGSLTTLAAGLADIRATYNGVTGVLQLTVSQRPHLSGIVTDAANGRALSGAPTRWTICWPALSRCSIPRRLTSPSPAA